jgi:hypothetical protein
VTVTSGFRAGTGSLTRELLVRLVARPTVAHTGSYLLLGSERRSRSQTPNFEVAVVEQHALRISEPRSART